MLQRLLPALDAVLSRQQAISSVFRGISALPRHSFASQPEPAIESPPTVKLLINGEFRESEATEWVDVTNPATQEVVSRLPETTPAEFNAAVQAAKDAFPKWRNTPLPARSRIMLKLQELIRQNMDELAANVTLEQGKTLPDARGDVFRGLEVVEYACSLAPDLMGDYIENVATGMDTYSIRQPLGVRARCPRFARMPSSSDSQH